MSRSNHATAFLVAMSLLGVAVVGWAATPLTLPPGAKDAARQIDKGALEGPVRMLSHDLLEGRGPASRGDMLARTYIASVLELLGLHPAAPGGGWDQRFEIVGVTSHTPPRWSFGAAGKQLELRDQDDFIAVSGIQEPSAVVAGAELVFIGYGIQAPEYGWDDLKGANLKGKVVVVMNDDPDWDPALFEGPRRTQYGRWTYKYENAARAGALAAIIIHTTPSAAYPWTVVQTSWAGEQFDLVQPSQGRVAIRAWTTEDASRRLLALGGFDLDALIKQARNRDFKPIPLGITTSLVIPTTITHGETGNVLGMLPGSDPTLKDEVVVFSAHHDHLGVGRPDARGDTIYNGAVDNASGVAQVLAIAKALTALPERPRRSILFALVAGEESSLLGSYYLATHPPVPVERLVADINFDAGNIFGRTRDVTEIGKGLSTLDTVLAGAAALQGRMVTDDPFPEHGSYYRSDQYSFAKVGVPGLYFRGGIDFIGRPASWGRTTADNWLKAHYHQPSDELTPEWLFDGMIEDTQLGFFVGLAVANAADQPTWLSGAPFQRLRWSPKPASPPAPAKLP
jgi:Zn-dependent M28 family amino/carboxypeptidase